MALKLLPSVVVAVIVAEPVALAITNPLLLTDTIELLLDVQATILFAALLGSTVAVNCNVPPVFISALVLFNEIDVARTGLEGVVDLGCALINAA